MYCGKCGEQNIDNATFCIKCGNKLGMAQSGGAQPAQVIPNYLAQAILVTILCCLPLGIVAIINSAQVNGKIQAGDLAGALQKSKEAKKWCWVSFVLGLITGIVYIIVTVVAGLH